MNDKLKDKHTDDLCDALLTLKTREECYSLFEDLCTISEIKSLAQRFQVAILLEKGHTYSEILNRTKFDDVLPCMAFLGENWAALERETLSHSNNTK